MAAVTLNQMFSSYVQSWGLEKLWQLQARNAFCLSLGFSKFGGSNDVTHTVAALAFLSVKSFHELIQVVLGLSNHGRRHRTSVLLRYSRHKVLLRQVRWARGGSVWVQALHGLVAFQVALSNLHRLFNLNEKFGHLVVVFESPAG